MKKSLILIAYIVSLTTLTAQIRSINIDLSESDEKSKAIETETKSATKAKIKSDKEFVVPNKQGTTFYIFFQKDKDAYNDAKITLLTVDSSAQILQEKVLNPNFPKLNTLLTATCDDNGLACIGRLNKFSLSSKLEGIQLIRSVRLDKNTFEQTNKTLFEINYPTEQIVSFINKDSIQYIMTYEKKTRKVSFYGFDVEKLRFKKSYLLPVVEEKKLFDKVLEKTVEGKDFYSMINLGKLFLEDNTFHLVMDYNENQYIMSLDLSKDSASIVKMPLSLQSIVSLSAYPIRKTTGLVHDHKLFQLHLIEDILCLGIYDISTQKRLGIYEYKKGVESTFKNSPFYLDSNPINLKDQIKNNKRFFNEIHLESIALEVTDKDDAYQIKIGSINPLILGDNTNQMMFMNQMMFRQQQQLIDQNMRNIQKYAPPTIRSGGFRSIPVSKEILILEDPVFEAYFYLKIKKSDCSFSEGQVLLSKNILDKERDKLVKAEQVVTPDFKIKGKKGFGYYNKNEKKFCLKLEDTE